MKTMRTVDKPEAPGVILPASQWSSICLTFVPLPRKPLRFPHKFQREKKIGELDRRELAIPLNKSDMGLHVRLDLRTALVVRDILFSG
jgi:hypothetical protein